MNLSTFKINIESDEEIKEDDLIMEISDFIRALRPEDSVTVISTSTEDNHSTKRRPLDFGMF